MNINIYYWCQYISVTCSDLTMWQPHVVHCKLNMSFYGIIKIQTYICWQKRQLVDFTWLVALLVNTQLSLVIHLTTEFLFNSNIRREWWFSKRIARIKSKKNCYAVALSFQIIYNSPLNWPYRLCHTCPRCTGCSKP